MLNTINAILNLRSFQLLTSWTATNIFLSFLYLKYFCRNNTNINSSNISRVTHFRFTVALAPNTAAEPSKEHYFVPCTMNF